MGSQRIRDDTDKKEKPKKVKKGGEKKKEEKQEQKKEKKVMEDIRYIVRIGGKDLNGELPIYRALQGIKGISHRMALNVAIAFEKETGKKYDMRIGKMEEEFDKKLEEIVLEPSKHGLPTWMFNKRKDFEEGQDKHLVMADLDFAKRKDLQRLNEIKSYRGLRLSWGLPVRGQSTKSTHRGKGSTVGVFKKDAKK